MLADHLLGEDVEGDTCLLVRGVLNDEHLFEFASDFEVTRFPAEWLWGPGPLGEAVHWLRKENPTTDRVDPHDRPFLVEVTDGVVQRPRRPEIAAALVQRSDSDWHLILADHPLAAFNHVRNVLADRSHERDVCLGCRTETLASGNLSEVLDRLEERDGPLTPSPLLRVEVPTRW